MGRIGRCRTIKPRRRQAPLPIPHAPLAAATALARASSPSAGAICKWAASLACNHAMWSPADSQAGHAARPQLAPLSPPPPLSLSLDPASAGTIHIRTQKMHFINIGPNRPLARAQSRRRGKRSEAGVWFRQSGGRSSTSSRSLTDRARTRCAMGCASSSPADGPAAVKGPALKYAVVEDAKPPAAAPPAAASKPPPIVPPSKADAAPAGPGPTSPKPTEPPQASPKPAVASPKPAGSPMKQPV
jgi:hypothetical protein